MTRREASLYVVAGIGLLTMYFVTSRAVASPVEVAMPAWVPFAPVLTLPYLLQVVVSYLLMFVLRPAPLRQAVFRAYVLTISATFAIWMTWPTMMPRPLAPDGWWNWPYAVMAGADLPVHIFPAGHIQMPVLITWAFWFDRPRSLWWLLPAQLVATIGIATTWQHRPVDIAAGALMALGAGVAFGVSRHGRNATRAAP
jgi:hypothetical protein